MPSSRTKLGDSVVEALQLVGPREKSFNRPCPSVGGLQSPYFDGVRYLANKYVLVPSTLACLPSSSKAFMHVECTTMITNLGNRPRKTQLSGPRHTPLGLSEFGRVERDFSPPNMFPCQYLQDHVSSTRTSLVWPQRPLGFPCHNSRYPSERSSPEQLREKDLD